MPNYTKIEDLMDIEDFFQDSGRGQHSMSGMPPQKNQSFQQQMISENDERDTKMTPLAGKMRNNVNMARAMNGGMPTMPSMAGMAGMAGMPSMPNSGSIYPSNPMMHSPPELTNPYYNEFNVDDASEYKLGPKAYPQKKPGNNSYNSLENFSHSHISNRDNLNCIDVANHIKNCPICSKFYENDKSMYVVAIIILIIICIILIRKVLENYEK